MNGRFKINSRGFWENSDAIGHWYDKELAIAIATFFREQNAKTVADFGCGLAPYSAILLNNGFKCRAFDGNPNVKTLTGGIGEQKDLSKTIKLGERFDWIISLEVGEHIPITYEQIFIDNICRHAKYGIILSWGVESMSDIGDGHVNCRSNGYIINEMNRRGWRFEKEITEYLRSVSGKPHGLFKPAFHNGNEFVEEMAGGAPQTAWWFRETLMVFRK